MLVHGGWLRHSRLCKEIRSAFFLFLFFFFFVGQALWVWTVSLPVTIVNASSRDPGLRPQDIIGWIMWSVGLLIEATADQQKLSFKNAPENRGKWCNVGVWKYSRHPNYLGEVGPPDIKRLVESTTSK